MTLKVSCPTCNKPVVWQPESTYRPFCSDRCRLIDLGEWASENHKISQPILGGGEITEDMLDALEDQVLQQHKFFVEPE
jgi:hypothetical protein